MQFVIKGIFTLNSLVLTAVRFRRVYLAYKVSSSKKTRNAENSCRKWDVVTDLESFAHRVRLQLHFFQGFFFSLKIYQYFMYYILRC